MNRKEFVKTSAMGAGAVAASGFEIQASMSHDYGNEGYRRYLSAYPGGIMFLLGCHHIDWIAHLLGRPVNVTPILGSTQHGDGQAKNNCWTILDYPYAIVSIHASD